MTKVPSSTRHKIFFMDSSFAAILGAYLHAQEIALGDRILALNIGNAHTLAATVVHGKIFGLFDKFKTSLFIIIGII